MRIHGGHLPLRGSVLNWHVSRAKSRNESPVHVLTAARWRHLMQASMHVVARVIGWIILIVCCLWWVVEAQEQFAPSALQEIERVIEKYGKRPVIELIRSKKSG